MNKKSSILYLSDLYYQASKRVYCSEDIFITSKLRNDFDIVICNPKDSSAFEKYVDGIVVRNTGPVIYYKEEYHAFRERAVSSNFKVYNNLSGKADMCGKQYLVDLTKAGFPVIHTVDTAEDISTLPDADSYVLKLKDGADSIGMKFIEYSDFRKLSFDNEILQPKIDFKFEVSFYFIDKNFQYALYAPDPMKRWELKEYEFTNSDLEFAKKFIEWNEIEFGIQRVDACLTKEGELLLVELEDLNPYLSLSSLSSKKQDDFIENFRNSLKMFLDV